MRSVIIKVISILRKNIVIHPILLAVFPVLFLYSQNISETSAGQIYLPILFSVTGILVIWFLFYMLMKNAFKSGLAATLFTVFFFSYGRVYELFQKWNISGPGHAYLFPIFLFICGYCIYFIWIAKRDFNNTTKILNFISVILILINVGNIIFYQINKPELSVNSIQSENGSINKISGLEETKPDIYFIVLDEYAHPDTMKEYYNYDNSKFMDFLEEKGFYWASESRTRTSSTFYSIASTLNMEYITNDLSDTFVYEKIANAQVPNILNSLGYKIIHIGSWYDLNKFKINNSIYFNLYSSSGNENVLSDFRRILWNTTLLSPFYDHIIENQFNTLYRDGFLGSIEKIKNIPDYSQPKFVFTHFICPHEPFVFGADGEYISLPNWDNWGEKQYYLGQYEFVTQKVMEAINSLLEKSTNKPIIIIQSDHGIRNGHINIDIGANDWQKILNVYYFPEYKDDNLYDNISPVNSFRILFNNYFDMNFELISE